MTAPVRVVAVDVTGPLPAIDTEGRYRRARIFAFAGVAPVGELSVELPAAGLPGQRVGELLAEAGLVQPAVATPVRSETGGLAAPLISVVVATNLARAVELRRCLDALRRQDHPRVELIVVVNRRGIPPGVELDIPPGARLLMQERGGVSVARNRGWEQAVGEIVAFTDDDAVPEPWWLRAVAERFAAEPDADCVAGLVLPAELETAAQVWFEESGNAFHQRYRPASFAGGPYAVTDRLADDPAARQSIYAMGPFGTGCNLALRRDALASLGGFDAALGPGTPSRAGEDLHLLLRLLSDGRRLAFEPSAVVWHRHRRDEGQLRRQVAGFGRGFTAMLTAAVLRNPGHLRGLALHARSRQRPSAPVGIGPAWLGRTRRRGELLGPAAYLAGRLRLLGWRR